MFYSSIFRELLETKPNLLNRVLEELIKNKVYKTVISNYKFGEIYSKPFVTLELECENDKRFYIALQDSFELIMRKETIAYFLAETKKEAFNIFDECILINFNLFKNYMPQKGQIIESNINDKKIIDLNIKMETEEETIANEFVRFLNSPDNPRFFSSCYEDVKEIKIGYEELIYKTDKFRMMDFDKGIRDRISFMDYSTRKKNTLMFRLIELNLRYNFRADELYSVFEEFKKEEIDYIIEDSNTNFIIATKLISIGKSFDQIKSIVDMPWCILYIARDILEASDEK